MAKLTDKELIQELQHRFDENTKALEELNKLTIELKEVNTKLEESEQIKSHFLSHIRNEIINPLASIIGISKNIQELPKDKLFKIIDFSKLIHQEAFDLDQQLKNIFAAAEVEAGETNPTFNIIDIKEIISEEIENYEQKFANKKIEHKLEFFNENPENEKLLSDEAKIRLIYSNLLRNAITFSKEYSKINTKIRIDSENLYLTVQDFGIGISTDNVDVIFDRFRKINNSINSINRGHGLGLSIVMAYVSLLNGDIDVETEIDRGSTFTIKLPLIDKENIDDKSAILNEFLFDNDTEEIF